MLLKGWTLWGATAGTKAQWTHGAWIVAGGVIRHARPAEAEAPADLSGYFTPGFVDVHCHVGIGPHGPVAKREREDQIRADLATGVLTVRDCGSPVDNSELVGRADLPTLIRCGQHIARTKRYLRGLPREVEPGDLPTAMAQEARRGGGWVKIVGDWIDRAGGADADLDPLWPRQALIDGVAAAHEAGARVAVHCFSHRAVDDLLEAGVDDIEHGTGMDADQMAEAAARGIMVTPTLLQTELFGSFADQAGTKFPVYGATMRAMWMRRREHAQALFDSGVPILPGTDSGGYQEHGVLGDELRAWAAIGVATERILDIATWQARLTMGQDALADGAVADIVHFEEDPRGDERLWGVPTTVIRGGQVVSVK
ncbi:amidohydrolase family protein [Schaalia suimastitidis]|uniref:amidohydrolase family protein n=1 Tax=Schaalia suimastitidis TaxID=121163 RepID=UPI00040BC39B|nr:amidohydrolase family protein [Schaalia suimastitidis]